MLEKKLEKLKLLLSEMLLEDTKLEFASVTSDEGVVLFYEELKEGSRIYTKDEEGNNKELENGTYVISTEDEITTIEVENSIIKSVEVKEVEKEEPKEEEVTEVEIVAEEEVIEDPTNKEEEPVNTAIEELRKEVNELYAIVDTLKKELEELKVKPATESVEQEFEQVTKKELKGASRYTQYIKRN